MSDGGGRSGEMDVKGGRREGRDAFTNGRKGLKGWRWTKRVKEMEEEGWTGGGT